MFSKKGYKEVQPALYYVRDMQNKGYSPLLQMGGGKQKPGKTEITHFSMVQKEFKEKLREMQRELFDCTKPFEQCKDAEYCTYCDFKKICRRKALKADAESGPDSPRQPHPKAHPL